MSAKQTLEKPEKKVDEVSDQLSEATIEDDAAAKKREKKLRQKAKKEAAKTDESKDNGTTEGSEKNGDENNKETKSKKKNKNKKSGGPKTQTDPPSIPISELFSNGNFPEGQIMQHPIANDDSKAKDRFSSEEARALDRAQLDMYNEIRYVNNIQSPSGQTVIF